MKSYGVTIPITPLWQYFHIVLHNYLVCGSKLLSPWKKSYIQKTSFLCHGLVSLIFCLSIFHLRHARYCDMDTEAALSLSFSFTSFVLSF